MDNTLKYKNNLSLLSRLNKIKDIENNSQWDTLFIAKLILRGFDVSYNEELISILQCKTIHWDIKKLIVSYLTNVTFDFLLLFLWEENINLLSLLDEKCEKKDYSELKYFYKNYKNYSDDFLLSLTYITRPINKIDNTIMQMLSDENIHFLVRMQIAWIIFITKKDLYYKKIYSLHKRVLEVIKWNIEKDTYSQQEQNNKPTTTTFKPEKEFQNNLWDIEADGNKKAVVFYLRYDEIEEPFDQILKKIIQSVKFNIKSWNCSFQKIVIVFRWVKWYDRSLVDLIDDWNNIIRFAFVEWNDFKELINSPNRHVVHFSNWTPEELLDKKNWKSIITEKIDYRFNLSQHWITDFIKLPWSSDEKALMEDSYYIDTFHNCITELDPSFRNEKVEKIINILKIDKKIK